MFKTFLSIVAVCVLQLSFAPSPSFADNHKGSAKIKVLLIDGQNNHDWKRCSPVMMETLKATGRFTIEVATVSKAEVAGFNPDFKKYDGFFPITTEPPGRKKPRNPSVQYIKGGGNLVVVHVADNSFPKWKEFNEMIGLGAGEDE